MWMLLVACTAPDHTTKDSPDIGTDSAAEEEDSVELPSDSDGCGKPSNLRAGGVQVEIDAGAKGGGIRGFFLSLPKDYDPDVPHRLVLGYPGTNWVGEQIQPYLDLEKYASEPTIFAYPDPLWRDFDGWGNYGGWLLGPHAAPADGMEDLVYTEAILDELEASYCIDTERIFATGHSWGGDMAAVVACFLGDRVRAAIPIAANEPYWFRPDQGDLSCAGNTAVWTFFGIADDHFTWQDYPGQFGEEQDNFWAEEHGCNDKTTDLNLSVGSCIEHKGCTAETRLCLYGAESGHQAPEDFAGIAMDWWEGF